MTTADITSAPAELPSPRETLEYRAPFLIEKLLKERIVETPEDGEALFTEVKKYLLLNRMHPDRQWTMFSRLVDEVWHQFVLFTTEYFAFCRRYFGGYLHHAPGNAPDRPAAAAQSLSVEIGEFQRHYEALFGTPIPEVWRDTAWITLRRRAVVNDALGPLHLEDQLDTGMVAIIAERGTLISVSSIARDALEFMLQAGAFYVRELPGDLDAEEKLGLVEMLMTHQVLLLGA